MFYSISDGYCVSRGSLMGEGWQRHWRGVAKTVRAYSSTPQGAPPKKKCIDDMKTRYI